MKPGEISGRRRASAVDILVHLAMAMNALLVIYMTAVYFLG